MATPSESLPFMGREQARASQFHQVWNAELGDVFADVAGYYDRANNVISLGTWGSLQQRFIDFIELKPNQRSLDVCAGTNAVGIALLGREPTLELVAMDRSREMQSVGRDRARARNMAIAPSIGDAHHLPFPDNSFDMVTLQWASRHLRIISVMKEIHRVLRPGGRFYHCDLLRPESRVVEAVYYGYLRVSMAIIARIFKCGPAALNCQRYFIDALRMFYSARELSDALEGLGFRSVRYKSLLGGTIAFHHAEKA